MVGGLLNTTLVSKYGGLGGKLLSVCFVAFLVVAFSKVSLAAVPWFAVQNGGVLSGFGGAGVLDTVPSPLTVLIQGGDGFILATDDKNVKKADGSDTGDDYVTGLGSLPDLASLTQLSTMATPYPTGSCTSLFSGSLNPNSTLVYSLDGNCFNTGVSELNETTKYSLASPGVVILYVTDSTTLTIDKDVQANSADQRIIVISGGSIKISKDVQHIEAALISLSDIIVKHDSAPNNVSLAMEGPFYSNSGVSLTRDLAVNSVPGVYVTYNPFYVNSLLKQIHGLDVGNFSSGVRWIYE